MFGFVSCQLSRTVENVGNRCKNKMRNKIKKERSEVKEKKFA